MIKLKSTILLLFLYGLELFSQEPLNGLVAFYPFNSNPNDESVNENNGTVYGANLTYDRCGTIDSAYYFDGVNDYILVNNHSSLNFSDEITLCAWIKPEYFLGHGNSAIVSKGYYSHVEPYYQYHLGITGNEYPNTPGRFSFSLSINSQYVVVTADSIWNPDEWYFVTGTYDGNYMRIFINGELAIENYQTGLIDIYDEPLCIGRTYRYPGSQYTPGVIDDIRIYNRAITPSEIQHLYFTNCRTLPDQGLQSFYPFTGNANDESGNEHHGNVRGAVLTTDRCNVENSAFAFDGGNNYIDIGDITEFDGSNALTISAWIYTEGISDEHSGTIISKYNTFGHSERVFIFDVARYQENSLRFAMYGADGNSDWEQEIATVPIPLSVWNHVVVTWDGLSHNIEFYINGIKVNSDYSQNGNRPTRIYDKSSTLMIGASESGYTSPDYLFNGSIDEILTYTRVLTQEEILSLYYYDCENRSPVVFYPFNGNANDALDGGNDGVLHGPVLTSDRCGNLNSAYLFDGIDDYISLDPSYIIPQSTGTFAAWVYFNSLSSTQYLGCVGDIHSQDHYLSLVRFDPVYGTFTIFRRRPGMADIIAGSTTVTTNQWYFVVMTSDGNEWNLYVNGEKEELTVVSGQNTGDWAHELTGVDNWLLGCIDIQEPHDPAFLDGKLDDVRIYDYALNQTEILALYTYNCVMEVSGDEEVCQGQDDVLYSVPYLDNVTYTWNYSGNGATVSGNSNVARIDFSPEATSGFLTVSAARTGQPVDYSSISVNVNRLPGAPHELAGPSNVCRNEGPYFYTVPDVESAENYIWTYTGQNIEISGHSNSVSVYFFENATSGSLSVAGINQCGSGEPSENFPVLVNDCGEIPSVLNIPNSFSPNGDNVNDRLIIQGLRENTKIEIFNRNGKLVYKSDNYLNDWDGFDINGTKLITDTYWYIISIPGIGSEFKGFLYIKE